MSQNYLARKLKEAREAQSPLAREYQSQLVSELPYLYRKAYEYVKRHPSTLAVYADAMGISHRAAAHRLLRLERLGLLVCKSDVYQEAQS